MKKLVEPVGAPKNRAELYAARKRCPGRTFNPHAQILAKENVGTRNVDHIPLAWHVYILYKRAKCTKLRTLHVWYSVHKSQIFAVLHDTFT